MLLSNRNLRPPPLPLPSTPPLNSALTFPDDKVNPPTALGQLLWEWTGQYLCLSCVCTVRVSVRVGETSTSRFTCSSSYTSPARLHTSSLSFSLSGRFWCFFFGYFLVLVWVVFIFISFFFCFSLLCLPLWVGMSSHILATVAACVAVNLCDFFDHWQCSGF